MIQDRVGSIIYFTINLCALATPVAVIALRLSSDAPLKLFIVVATLLFIFVSVVHRFWLKEWLFWRRFCKAYKSTPKSKEESLS